MTPETKARQNIDQKLELAGWVIQDMKQINLGAGLGVAVREYPTDTGPADYVLFVNRHAVGVIEAKKDSAAENLTVTETQTERYANATLKWRTDNTPLPFLFEATGQIIRFTDGHDPAPRSREIFHFFKPNTLAEWLAQTETLRRRLAEHLPALPIQNLRDCQVSAVSGLEESLARNKPRALVHMATGAGKTFTAITSVYRLLKFGGAKRILFLVDTRNLGKQAHQEFMAYTPPDDARNSPNCITSSAWHHQILIRIRRSASAPYSACTPFCPVSPLTTLPKTCRLMKYSKPPNRKNWCAITSLYRLKALTLSLLMNVTVAFTTCGNRCWTILTPA
jgi:type I restriction enzyme R subunit